MLELKTRDKIPRTLEIYLDALALVKDVRSDRIQLMLGENLMVSSLPADPCTDKGVVL